MDFQDKLRSLIGENVEVVTGLQAETGVLIRVGDSTATILAAGAPGYGSGQSITYQLDRVTYVRAV